MIYSRDSSMIVVEKKKETNKQEYISIIFGILLHGLNDNCTTNDVPRIMIMLSLVVVVVGCSCSFHYQLSFCYLSFMIYDY